jgi:hypothetical protein
MSVQGFEAWVGISDDLEVSINGFGLGLNIVKRAVN